MEFERGPGFDLATYDPCPSCGTRDVDWRDPNKLDPGGHPMPAWPPPFVAEGWQCLGCKAKDAAAKDLVPKHGEPPPGVRIRLRPYRPEDG